MRFQFFFVSEREIKLVNFCFDKVGKDIIISSSCDFLKLLTL